MTGPLDGPMMNGVTGLAIPSRRALIIVCSPCGGTRQRKIAQVSVSTRGGARVQLTAFRKSVNATVLVTSTSLLHGPGYPDREAWCPKHGVRPIGMQEIYSALDGQIGTRPVTIRV